MARIDRDTDVTVGPGSDSHVRTQELLMNPPLKRFMQDESGATAIEYGLIAAGISVAIIAVVNNLGGQLKNTFSTVSNSLKNAGK
jgi:pilus assembly protein Flp/PilA